MDKSSYETYEYLPTTENEANQFFVVQDDGTFLSVNRQIQYVTQVQDVKEVLESVEPCTVYDVSSQQFFLDVDDSTELISVSDQFIIPDGESNIFANNYLLPVPNTTEQQVEHQDVVEQYQETETQADTEEDTQSQRQINSCTEITLSDEQYQTLEQKGWLLLETNEKVFVLDSLGLHDITTNNELIQKLKVEGQSSNENIEPEDTNHSSNQEDTIQFVIGEDGIKLTEEIKTEKINERIEDHDNVQNAESAETPNPVTVPQDILPPQTDTVLFSSAAHETLRTETGNTFKIKTDVIFKDLPEKIVLGETAQGKKLYAKIIKLDTNNVRKAIEIPPRHNRKHVQRKQKSTVNNKNVQQVQMNNTSLNEGQFETLIRLAMRSAVGVKCSAEDVASANGVVTQLLKVPAFKPSVLDRNLIITKDVSVQDKEGTLRSGGLPSLVTGRVTALDKDRYNFVHQPGMLQRLMNNSDNDLPPSKKGASQSKNINVDDNNVLHVHVTEIKRADNVLRVSITLNKRQLPSDTNVTFDSKRKQPSMVFGCSACAAVFQTENELKEHQETQCIDAEDVLTIDIDKNTKGYTIERRGKEKSYSCKQCQLKFSKLYNCLQHLKTHFNCIEETNDEDKKSEIKEEQKDGIYKCKMCSSTYFHPSTLSKHIVTKHIKIRQN